MIISLEVKSRFEFNQDDYEKGTVLINEYEGTLLESLNKNLVKIGKDMLIKMMMI